jgi:UDP-glucose 4-epimerase
VICCRSAFHTSSAAGETGSRADARDRGDAESKSQAAPDSGEVRNMAVMGKRVCITGGAGFIGSHLVERLIDDNQVVVYDNLHRNAIQFAPLDGHPHLHFIKGDVMDYDGTRRALDGCQVVIHCAAIAGVYSVDRNAVTTMEVNLLGTHQVVRAALAVGVERFVEFSTSEVYGPFIHKGREDDLTTIGPIGESRWVYAASKLASEHLSYAHYKEDGLPLAIVRPFNVYGPRQVGDGAIRGMILQALQQAPITLYNDGTQIRAWCYVDDFVDGVLRCAEWPEALGHAFNIGNPQGTITNLELARMIIRLTNSTSDIVFKPHPGPEVDLRVPSIEKAQRLLGYNPQIALEAGIGRTIPWYQEHAAGITNQA